MNLSHAFRFLIVVVLGVLSACSSTDESSAGVTTPPPSTTVPPTETPTSSTAAAEGTTKVVPSATPIQPTTTKCSADLIDADVAGEDLVDTVAAALQCDGEAFRSDRARLLDEYFFDDALPWLDDESVARLLACSALETARISDTDLLALAGDARSAQDFEALLGEAIGGRCQSSLPGLGSMDGRDLIDAVIDRSGGIETWSPIGAVELNPGTALSSRRAGYNIFVALDPETKAAIAATLVFDPSSVEPAVGEVILGSLLEALGVESEGTVVAAVLLGESSPSLPPIQICTGAEQDLVVVIIQSGNLACLG